MKTLEVLAKELAQVRAQAEALGIFVEDRELLTCPGCGLAEDVAIDGRLFTLRIPDVGEDAGLRFGTSNECGLFRCPSCGGEVAEPTTDADASG